MRFVACVRVLFGASHFTRQWMDVLITNWLIEGVSNLSLENEKLGVKVLKGKEMYEDKRH